MPYVPFPITTAPDAFLQRAFDYLEEQVPGWTPSEGNLDVLILAAVSRMAGELRDLIADVPDTIFMRFGNDLLGIPPKEPAAAMADFKFTMIDTAGYTVPAGTTVGVRTDDGTSVAFTTLYDLVIGVGSDNGTVVTQAIVAGSYANGIGLYNNAFLVDAVVGVLTVEMVTIPSGGADEESNFEYMNRLSDRASLLTPVPILAADYALLAMDISGVGRSLGIDGYNPGDDTYNNERYVTVAIADVNGAATSSILKSEVQAYLESFREVNFEVRVMDPTYTVINVVVNLTRLDNADSTLVVLAVEQALAEYLNPASWGSPARDGADPGDTRNWRQVTKVRYLEVAQIINNVSGVDYINTLTVNGGTADITLTGDAPLPSASSTYTVTVVSP